MRSSKLAAHPGQGTEAAVDHAGNVSHRPAAGRIPDDLVQYARGFLLTNRTSVKFLYRHQQQWLAVSLERIRKRHGNQDHALLGYVPTEPPQGITARELDVLTLVALGLTNIEIASRLGTRPRTVTTQVERLLHKLGQSGRAGLASLVVDANLIVLPIPGGPTGVTQIAPVGVQRFAQSMDRTHVSEELLQEIAPQKRPFILGTLAPLSGLAADDGEELVRGAALAVETLNNHGGIAGRFLEHVVVDADIFDPGRVREAMAELCALEVDAITTSYASGENPFLLDMAADYGRPFLHTATFEQQVDLVRRNPVRYGMVFQTCPSEKYYAQAFVRFLRELEAASAWSPTTRSISVIEMDSESTRITTPDFTDAVRQIGWTVGSIFAVPLDAPSWERIAARISRENPSVVLVAHFIPEEIAKFHALLKEAGYQGLTYSIYGASIPRFGQLLGAQANGVVWSSVTSRYADELSENFQRAYTLRYATEPGLSQASAAYDQVRLLALAWAELGSADPQQTAGLLRTSAYRGLNGIYYFGEGQSAQSYPDGTNDPTLGQMLMTYQFQNGVSVALTPAPYGEISRFIPPPF